jgi:hypothetical protein
MRRPLKPFVTEYKASNRRNPVAVGEQGVFETERQAPKPFDFMLKAEPEESYDAAMRAADALFSIPAANKAADQVEPVFNGGSPADSAPPEKNGGRILRVLDEEPSPEYVALEVERAPKRRGRKPGSKNKPKMLVSGLSEPLEKDAPVWHLPNQVAPVSIRPAVPAARKIPAIVANAALANAIPTDPVPETPRTSKRFPWVRDKKLKPGEDWKRRRLPRICW